VADSAVSSTCRNKTDPQAAKSPLAALTIATAALGHLTLNLKEEICVCYEHAE
jgi:hypothetical protein